MESRVYTQYMTLEAGLVALVVSKLHYMHRNDNRSVVEQILPCRINVHNMAEIFISCSHGHFTFVIHGRHTFARRNPKAHVSTDPDPKADPEAEIN